MLLYRSIDKCSVFKFFESSQISPTVSYDAVETRFTTTIKK